MKPLAAGLFLFAVAAFFLPGLTAQDKADDKKDVEKKDAEKKDAEKKDAEKKDAEKKDAKDEKKGEDKTDEKKDSKKEDVAKKKAKFSDPEEEKILTGTVTMRARIQNMDANSAGEFSVQLPYAFPAKIKATQAWYAQLLQAKSVTQETYNQYRQKMSQANVIDVRTGQGMKVRTMFPPLEFDLKGNVKRWTQKEIATARAGSKLPGLPAQFDALKAGQVVDLYVAKTPVKKTAAKDKKKNLDDDLDDPSLKPEVLMVVVIVEAQSRP